MDCEPNGVDLMISGLKSPYIRPDGRNEAAQAVQPGHPFAI